MALAVGCWGGGGVVEPKWKWGRGGGQGSQRPLANGSMWIPCTLNHPTHVGDVPVGVEVLALDLGPVQEPLQLVTDVIPAVRGRLVIWLFGWLV